MLGAGLHSPQASHKKKGADLSAPFFLICDQRRAFGSLIPVLLVPGPDAAREFTLSRSSEVVPVLTLRVPGVVEDDDA